MKEKAILIDVSHLSNSDRIDAAIWCFNNFNPIDVDFWGMDGKTTSEFAFQKEQDALAFTLLWS